MKTEGSKPIQTFEKLFFKIRILFFVLLSVFTYQLCAMFRSERNFTHEMNNHVQNIETFYLLYTCVLLMLCGMLVLR
jgi:hypothetical protein